MRTIVLLILYSVITLLCIPIFLLCAFFRLRAPLYAIGKGTLRIGKWILGIRLEVCGFERIDRTMPYLFMANHLSILDGPLLFMLIPQPVRVILKKEAFRIPVIGLTMLHIGFIPVDRKHLRGGRRSITKAASMIREKSFSFLIFPEGTRSRDGQIQVFKRGGFFLALESGVPIVPITIKGTYELMPRGTFFIKRGMVRVFIHDPVPVQNFSRHDLPQLMMQVSEAVASKLED